MGSICLYYLNDTCACVIRVCLRRSTIKTLRSDRGGEYLDRDFEEFLVEHGIVSQLTAPGTQIYAKASLDGQT